MKTTAPEKSTAQNSRQDIQPPAGHTGKTSGKKADEKLHRERGKIAGIMQDGGDGLQNGRAGGFYAHGIRAYTRAIYGPPIVPPTPMQEPPAIPAKSTGQHQQRKYKANSTAQRQAPTEQQHSPTAPQPTTAATAATVRKNRQNRRHSATPAQPRRRAALGPCQTAGDGPPDPAGGP